MSDVSEQVAIENRVLREENELLLQLNERLRQENDHLRACIAPTAPVKFDAYANVETR